MNKRGAGPSANGDAGAKRPRAMVAELRSRMADLPDALARIALYIVENPEKVLYASVADLSRHAQSGQASVIRLCHDLGFAGYSEFKVALAQELAKQPAKTGDPSSWEAWRDHLVDGIGASMRNTAELVDLRELRRVTARFPRARRIDIYGAGVSGMAGEILAYRLLRLGITAHCFRDPTMAHEVANGLGSDCTAVGISASGVTPDTVEFLRMAKQAGAHAVAICCRPESTLGEIADDVLQVAFVDPPSTGGSTTGVPRIIVLVEMIAGVLTTATAGRRK